jgi:hypothetical protein
VVVLPSMSRGVGRELIGLLAPAARISAVPPDLARLGPTLHSAQCQGGITLET